jgi:hypothetical protein
VATIWIAGMPSDEISHEDNTVQSSPGEMYVTTCHSCHTISQRPFGRSILIGLLGSLDITYSIFYHVGSSYVNYPLGIIVKELIN